jgi:hypothetical protein
MSDLPTCLSERVRTARKAHQCDDCLEQIDPGEVYHDSRLLYDGRAYTWRSHLGCYALRQTEYARDLESLPEGWVSGYELADYATAEEALACLDRAGVTDEGARLATLRRAGILRDAGDEP